ncbi:hypothetical protein HC174_07155 [Salinimicrobium sp. CDJ15-81-2]|nr:hypothetical protein [Salinimicrobium nanhaiense]
MENSHDIILIIVIGAIILLQVYVFWGNYRKIQDYKKTIQDVKNFEIVEVSVPEEWISKLEIDEILQDPAAFQKLAADYSPNGIDASTGRKNSVQENYNDEIEFPEDEDQDDDKLPEEPEYIEEEEEYTGPFKTFRDKLKNILE